MNLSAQSPFVSGPVPRNSLSPTRGPDAQYSGLLECPLTTRITKDVDSGYDVVGHGHCPHQIQTAAECFFAVAKALGVGLTKGARHTIMDAPHQVPGCSVVQNRSSNSLQIGFNTATSNVSCGAQASLVSGLTDSLVSVHVSNDVGASVTTITLTGPASVWWGVGFGQPVMKGSWAVIVEGNGTITERLLGNHIVGPPLPPSVTLKSSEVTAGNRTVILTRPMDGAHFSFGAAGAVFPIINAIGAGPALAYHSRKTAATLVLLPETTATTAAPAAAGACVCARQPLPFGSGKGSFVYTPVKGDPGERGRATKLGFSNRCAPQPRGDLLQQRNPTCDVRYYTGGQSACHHMFSLLDADQKIPWPEQPINYTLKWRFWYQHYDPSYHSTVQMSHLGKGTDWSIGSGPCFNGIGAEYDVPQCTEGMEGCSRSIAPWVGTWVHTITGVLRIGEDRARPLAEFSATHGRVYPVAAHLHCHAPTCLSMAIYVNATGELLCEETAVYGQGVSTGGKFAEPGYIKVPPCLWGSPENGLEKGPDLTDVVLRVVKHTNATYGHHGEMAHGEIYYIDTPKSE